MKRGLIILTLVTCALLGLRIFPASPLSDISPTSRMVLADDGNLLRLTLASDGQYRLWQPLENISPHMIEAMLLKEDRYFYYHVGINPIALIRAVYETYIGGNRQGASTLTMQLARRIYDLNSRSITGKFKQIFAAFWLEARYSKHDILEAYLNLAPMGGNIEGVAAASQIYFHKPASTLSLSNALSLAVMPQSPARRAHFKADFKAARDRLTQLWVDNHPENPLSKNIMAYISLGKSRQELPFIAPHFTRYQLNTSSDTIINTTLNIELQQLLEKQINHFVSERQNKGIYNAGTILVDTRDQSVKAWVGSNDFFNVDIQGQVDAVISNRSPGSTLKPFLYALAMDQGVIHPMSIIKDSPTAFGAFEPENFDKRFIGPITAKDALIRSRNLPAVWLANKIKNPDLYDFLQQANIKKLKEKSYYGLALALGGGDISMFELARLYTMLANQGVYYPLRTRQQQPISPISKSLLTPASSFLTLDILKDNPRSDGLPRNRWHSAWKTGTSWGYHDAWAAGVIGPYVLITWVGNFDATPNPLFIGAKTAGPLFFAISDALEGSLRNTPDLQLDPPDTIKKVDICAASGELPNRWCPKIIKSWFIPGVSPARTSTLHQPMWIDNKTNNAVCPPYDKTTQHQQVFAFWSSEMAELFEQANLPRKLPPPLPAACAKFNANRDVPPTITKPLANVTYTLRDSHRAEKIPLAADSIYSSSSLFWFADTQYLGKTTAGEILEWRPDHAGKYTISVTDAFGNSAGRTLTVTILNN